jgi:integrase
MRFTDRSIDALKPQAARHEVWEDGRTGLGLRVTPRGVKTFVHMYRFDGKARRLTLGRYAKPPAVGISLATARRMQGEAKEKLEAGIDPGIQVVEERRVERAAETFVELAALYIEKWAKPRKRSAAEDERILHKDVIPKFGKQKVGDIKKRDVVALLDDIVNRGAPIAANRTLAVTRKVFNYGLKRDVPGLVVNPCSGIDAPAPENERDRKLTDAEIVVFWKGLDNGSVDMSEKLRRALRMLLATATRRAEVARAAWNEFDLYENVWTIPASRTKNKKEHIVPLNALALSIIQDLKELDRDRGKIESQWLFPSSRGEGPISPDAISHALRRNLPHIGLNDLSPHDLRRSGATALAKLKVPRFIISRVLNHVDKSVTAKYDKYEYLAEKKDALDRLGVHIEALLAAGEADNVTVLDLGIEARTTS